MYTLAKILYYIYSYFNYLNITSQNNFINTIFCTTFEEYF